MAIGKNGFKVSRFNPENDLTHRRNGIMSSDDEDSQQKNSSLAVESDDEDDDQFDECHSGAGSDDFDLLELGQTGEEFCQVGDQTCSFPYELYDLPGFENVLSMEVWNVVLTEEERFRLAKYLPDMDLEDYVLTLKELFACENFHFGSPVDKLFEMLKGGLCEPRVALYRQGLNFLQRRQHYHKLRMYQNAMVDSLCQMRDVWLTCKGYSIEEKIRVLNIKKCQKSLMSENMEEIGSDSSEREEFGGDLRGKRARDGKLVPKLGKYSGYSMGLDSDNFTPGIRIVGESDKDGKRNPNRTLRLAGSRKALTKEAGGFTPSDSNVRIKSRRCTTGFPASRNKAAGAHETSLAVRMNEPLVGNNDEEETRSEVSGLRNSGFPRFGTGDKSVAVKVGKKPESSRAEEDVDNFMGVNDLARKGLHVLGRNNAINQLSDIKVLTAKPSHRRKFNFPDDYNQFTANNNMKYVNVQKSNLFLKENLSEFSDGSKSSCLAKPHSEFFSVDLSNKSTNSNSKNKKGKMGKDAFCSNANDKLLQYENRAEDVKDHFLANSFQNGGVNGAFKRDIRAFALNEETESDSSDQMGDDGDDANPLMRSKLAYPGGAPDLKYGSDSKKAKLSRKAKKDSFLSIDGSSQSTRNVKDRGEDLDMIRAKKSKMRDYRYMDNSSIENLHANRFSEPDNVVEDDDSQQFYPVGTNIHVGGSGNRFNKASLKSSFATGRRLKGEFHHDFDPPYLDDLFCKRSMAANNGVSFPVGKKNQMVEQSSGHNPEMYRMSKKRKVKDGSSYMNLKDNNDYLHDDAQLLLDSVNDLRKRGKMKVEEELDDSENGVSEPPFIEMEMEDVEEEAKPQRKHFPLITPTVHTGFSFSIIHLLSAVRMAMITTLPEDSLDARNLSDKNDAGQLTKEEQDRKESDTDAVNLNSSGVGNTTPSGNENLHPLTVQDVVNRLRSNPGDPCILETQEPLQDLVRGVLKIFSSRTAPLGAKAWKPLVVYEKSTKSWSWIGPVSHNSSDSEIIEEVTSPEAWGLPHKMLVKLVDSFANWLKISQETLQQIGSLPAPPLTLMQNILDEKERFKDLRVQKSLSTISPNSEEVRDYFRKEEILRYLIPDRAFSYTAADGKKSTVAPLRRCGGKPTAKARDHFMLKRDRPPHVTILCLVRDAAARLPGSIGTRADVCTLIRDSQYIVEEVADAQINQVVSGALDRLHYERDPCVQFDGERKLWVYLHKEREEEDFEDDGTSSTKTWRRQKKEVAEPSDQGEATVALSEPLGPSGFDVVSDTNDTNAEASRADVAERLELDYRNSDGLVEDNAGISYDSDNCLRHDPSPGTWNGHGLNSTKDNTLICQENSAHEDFGENTL